jgi:ADP-ribosylglycohydrolase
MKGVDHVRGALVGLAAGDALGTTLEFKKPGTFEPTTERVCSMTHCMARGNFDRQLMDARRGARSDQPWMFR